MTDTATTSAPNDPLRPFSEFLTDHAQGDADRELTLEFAELVQAVTAIGKKGRLTVTVNVEPAGSGHRNFKTSIVVEAKHPKPDPEESIFFAGDGGSWHRDDPYQTRLPLKRVPDRQPHLPQE